MESRVFRQEMPPYRPPEVQLSHSYKSQGEKYGSLMESGNRYHRDREREMQQHHRERVNSLDKTNSPSAFYPSSMHPRNMNKQQQDNTGSIGRRHHGCSASLSEANVRDVYGAMLSERNEPAKSLGRAAGVHTAGNPSKQRGGLEIVERERERDRDREKEYRRNTACNNSLDCKQDNLSSFAIFLHTRMYAYILLQYMDYYFLRCAAAIGSQL